MSPRSCSGGPKSSPRGPKTVPRAARSAPRGAQEQPGAHQKGALPFGRPPGPILATFWGALGFIFKQLWRPFRSSRALRQTIENTLRNH